MDQTAIDQTALPTIGETWGLIGTLLWGLLILVLFALVQGAAVLIYAQVAYGTISEALLIELAYDATAISLATISTLMVCGLVICAVIKLKKNSNLISYLALRRFGMAELWPWILVALAFMVISDGLTLLLGKPIVPEFMTAVIDSSTHYALLFFALVIAAPIFEEVFFRGFLISGLSNTVLRPLGAILISSIAWAVIHLQYDLYGITTIFIAGMVFGVARLRTNSLLVPIIMHAIFNLVATLQAIFWPAIKTQVI